MASANSVTSGVMSSPCLAQLSAVYFVGLSHSPWPLTACRVRLWSGLGYWRGRAAFHTPHFVPGIAAYKLEAKALPRRRL